MSNKIVLTSSDGECFEIEEEVALMSETIGKLVKYKGVCVECRVKLRKVTGKILAKVIEYCKKHIDAKSDGDSSSSEEDLKAWDAEYLNIDRATFFGLVRASTYLGIADLCELTSLALNDMIHGKDPEEICSLLELE